MSNGGGSQPTGTSVGQSIYTLGAELGTERGNLRMKACRYALMKYRFHVVRVNREVYHM